MNNITIFNIHILNLNILNKDIIRIVFNYVMEYAYNMNIGFNVKLNNDIFDKFKKVDTYYGENNPAFWEIMWLNKISSELPKINNDENYFESIKFKFLTTYDYYVINFNKLDYLSTDIKHNKIRKYYRMTLKLYACNDYNQCVEYIQNGAYLDFVKNNNNSFYTKILESNFSISEKINLISLIIDNGCSIKHTGFNWSTFKDLDILKYLLHAGCIPKEDVKQLFTACSFYCYNKPLFTECILEYCHNQKISNKKDASYYNVGTSYLTGVPTQETANLIAKYNSMEINNNNNITA